MIVIKRGEYFSLLSSIFVISVFLSIKYPAVFATHSPSTHKSSSTKDNITILPQHIQEQCIHKCPEQNRTNSEHLDIGCNGDCYINHCILGCRLWEQALESSCQTVCNKTDQELLEPKELYCVVGCNDALNRYFKWVKAEVGIPPAPALVADTLTATSLSLEWEIPEKFALLTRGKLHSSQSYLVQWRYEEVVGDWKFCRNQSMGDNSTVRVDNLQPYTKYRFRVALLLSKQHDEFLTSEQSVIISTLPMGVPLSEPAIVRAVAVDHTRISVTWEPGPFPNGPVLSYVLQIRDLSLNISALKDISAMEKTHFYMFEKLTPSNNYSVSVTMRNAEGEGPAALTIVSTPPEPELSNDEPNPTFILGTEYSVLSQGSDLLTESSKEFYTTDIRIQGIAIHIAKQLLFVSEESGFVYKAPLEVVGHKTTVLSPHSGLNFLPQLLSIDWLNNHLYILGEVRHPHAHRMWQISRCDLDGKGLTVATAGLVSKPNHIEVDPFNGYLFWVITGYAIDTGLFRLDLGDISNGVKHKVKPLHMIQGQNLAPFTVDHTRFRILVPFLDNNTVISVSLDGKDRENIRPNTNQPRFNDVRSLTMANGLFYWTNGEDIITEDFHTTQKTYFHNAYPGLSNRTYLSICINLNSAQPIPIPVNPPSNIQALLSASKAKVSWRVPHLLGNQGKGTWQNWKYELEIMNETSKITYRDLKTAHVYVDELRPNTMYIFRAAAYTKAGKGPWSTEFRAKTLNSLHSRYIIWSSDNGLLQSDVIGEHIDTLISQTELGEHYVSDIAWIEDMLFFVSNSSLNFFNRTSRTITKLGDFDYVESIAVDWIGKRLYWSNPTQQLITRSHLNGDQQETLPILAVAKELRIDSLRGFIYFSTGHAVESCRLNGKNRRTYYSVELYSGLQVMGLTLDLDNQLVYWIVRRYDSSSLYSAPMAGSLAPNVSVVETKLREASLQGPLTHFSDRLLWLQDNKTVIVGDMTGKNLAQINSTKLNGIRAISVIDPTHHIYPSNLSSVNVIPCQISNKSIHIRGVWTSFDIIWDPIENVNYGQVFYEIRIHASGHKDIVREVIEPVWHYSSHTLQPYSPLDITVRPFTFWGSAVPTRTHIHSPPAKPTVPTNSRIFITHYDDPLRGGLNIEATFRWNPPLHPNGPILGYRLDCWYEEDFKEKEVFKGLDVAASVEEKVLSNLVQNVTYFFRVLAYTGADSGDYTGSLSAETAREKPIPRVLVSTKEQIIMVDLDLNKSSPILNTGNAAKFMTYIAREKKIFWINEVNEVMSYNGTTQTKLYTINSEALSLAVDWVYRSLYWSHIDGNTSVLSSLDLTKYEAYKGGVVELVRREGIIQNILVSPMDRMIIWTERKSIDDDTTQIYSYNIYRGLIMSLELFPSERCPNISLTSNFRPFALETKSKRETHMIWTDKNLNLYSTSLSTEHCKVIDFHYNNSILNFVKDSSRIYWISHDNHIYAKNDHGTKTYNLYVPRVETLLAFYHQAYPDKKCLIPNFKEFSKYEASLMLSTSNTIKLKLPTPTPVLGCNNPIPAIKYAIYFQAIDGHHSDDSKCNTTTCQVDYSFENIKTIHGLKPFTKYKFQIGVSNYYADKMHLRMHLGPSKIYSTAAGAPSEPTDIKAEVISPNEVNVTWHKPKEINSNEIWYEIHWQTENPITGIRNRQQQVVYTTHHSLTKLIPKQSYIIWVRAYSTSDMFSESEIVGVETFQEPDNITLLMITSTSLTLTWQPHKNVSRFQLGYVVLSNPSIAPFVVYDSKHPEEFVPFNGTFKVTNLEPKTTYKFYVLLYYPKRDYPYSWPLDSRSVFETLGDRPTAPGKPLVKHLSGDVYKVFWEPSKDNGAPIEEYSLEALQSKSISNRVRRSPTLEISSVDVEKIPLHRSIDENVTEVENKITWTEDSTIDERWKIYYNGTELYWIPQELIPIHVYSFRVRARNSYGWGPYSSTSEPISEPYVDVTNKNSMIIIIVISMSFVLLIALIVCIITFFVRRDTDKKIFPDTTPRIPDVELANLREMPHGASFHVNVLYTTGPLSESDVASLPQIRRDQITMTKFLGSGAFGEVYEGCVKDSDDSETRVAIKTLRKGATEQEKAEFLQEAHLMSNFKHEHILQLIGVCFDIDSLYIIMELMQGGDLLSFLRQSRPTLEHPSSLTLLGLVSMCVDVASGCRYLEEMHFVHRDLACRNCLVSSSEPDHRVVKIGDFGLARDIYKNDYYRKEGEGLLPVRWMSPESLVDGVFTSQSDIWAFGVLCWEIMTLGQQPYPARNNLEVLHYVRDGGRLTRPTDCPEDLYQLMLKCWSYCPEDRPTFRYCLEVLQTLKNNTSDCIPITVQHIYRNAGNKVVSGDSGITSLPSQRIDHSIPTTSTGTESIPKYIELIYSSDDKPPNLVSEDYEIPITSLPLTEVSTKLPNCNTILTVAVPDTADTCSSLDALLPNHAADGKLHPVPIIYSNTTAVPSTSTDGKLVS
ncbi:protein sevenless isoform X2 [Lutzomyia longipalpis]|uniref:protein sevenless isoform X2 n=1 Tax=Lutzomyia longipalpis TaxID=7200 RepID=UPI0024843166|nr:protein sevenless isoform X2 [Lutzomyia longipalpis]